MRVILILCLGLFAFADEKAATPALKSIEVISSKGIYREVASKNGGTEQESTDEATDVLKITFHPDKGSPEKAKTVAAAYLYGCRKIEQELSVEPWKENGAIEKDAYKATARWKERLSLYTLAYLKKVGPITFTKQDGKECLVFSVTLSKDLWKEKYVSLLYVRTETRAWIRKMENIETESAFVSLSDPVPDPEDPEKLVIYTLTSVITKKK